MDRQQLIPHLFRTESGKITTVLSKLFGFDQIEVAEDITSETFMAALETWSYKGIPESPVAWLYSVAKNKAKNYFVRNRIFTEKVLPVIKDQSVVIPEIEIDLSDANITDSQLKMLFAICHPSIQAEAQIGLALRILCGFGIDEIANAFLTNKETINKRLFRAKEKLRTEKVQIAFPPETEITGRLDNVLRTLYLLFNEGYYSESHDSLIREDLSLEAMRLTHMLLDYEPTNLPEVNALFALMCFHASRFEARKNEKGEMVLYGDQDENLWNKELIARGVFFLKQSSQGNQISKYHIEASIAFWNTIKEDTKEKWENILQLYNMLLKIEYSPIAALNRTFALSKANGKMEAIVEAEKLQLNNNHYYFTLLGELYKDLDPVKSKENFEKALKLAKTNTEKKVIRGRL
ncbi:MAG TPA: sigma-70 family RNA polymerase sigma factor [Flavitalea sp.]|nr:sigma-70 family RNA polymerase sigma factor [Flavitalea sp.]